MKTSQLLTAAVMAGSLTLLSGCLVSSRSHSHESGVRISAATLEQIQIGKTTEGWLRAMLGEPSSVTDIPDRPGQRILRYTHRIEKGSGGAVFLIFAGSSKEVTTSRTYFEITDGIVTRYWTEP